MGREPADAAGAPVSWLRRIREERSGPTSTLAQPASWLLEAFGAIPSASGKVVTSETVRAIPAAYAAVRAISEDVASLPLGVYQRRSDGGRDAAATHPLHTLIHDSPNGRQTAIQFRETLIAHALLRGNGYAEILTGNDGYPTSFRLLHCGNVALLLAPDDTLWYQYTERDGTQTVYSADEILHVAGPGDDGFGGTSMVSLFRNALGLAMSSEEFASKFFANDGSPGGVLQHPGKLGKDAYDKLRASWSARHEGSSNAFKVAILEEDMKWQSVGFNQKDAQFLESRQFQIEEIARIFRVPPHLLQHLERSTNNNIEQQSIEYVVLTIRPWLVRLEQALNLRCLTAKERQAGFYTMHTVDGLLRGDAMSRNQALAIQRQNGIISADEWRALEDRNPLPNEQGKDYLVPLNYTTAADLGKTPAPSRQPPGAPSPTGAGTPNDGGRKALRRTGMLLLADAWTRVEHRRTTSGEKGLGEYADRAIAPALQALACGFAEAAGTEPPALGAMHAALIERYQRGVTSGTVDIEGLLTEALATIEALITAAGAAEAA